MIMGKFSGLCYTYAMGTCKLKCECGRNPVVWADYQDFIVMWSDGKEKYVIFTSRKRIISYSYMEM